MQLTFTQGLVKGQVDPIANSKLFLQKSGSYVNIYATTVPLTAAVQHGEKTYLIVEQLPVNQAWGPFPAGKTSWLYWDINMATGAVTRGMTNVEPRYGLTLPLTAEVDQHFYDLTAKVMKVFNGTAWVEKLRVFAAYVIYPGYTLHMYDFNSQVGLTGQYQGGYILYGLNGKAIKEDDGSFVNTGSNYMVKGGVYNFPLSFDYEPTYAIAAESIQGLAFVAFNEPSVVSLANHESGKWAAALAMTPAVLGQNLELKFYGVVRSDQFAFADEDINKPLWLDSNGTYTFQRPIGTLAQLLGIVIDTNAIFFAPRF